MLTLFSGEYDCRLDAKGRLTLPAKLRSKFPDAAQRVIYIRRGFEEQLVLYPQHEFMKLVQGMLENPIDFADRESREFERNFISGFEEIEMDENFRFSIPKKYVKELEIGRDVRVLGVLDKIEIWDTATREKNARNSAKELDELAKAYSKRK